MKPRKKRTVHKTQEPREPQPSPRNRALHIPLDFEQAVEGLLNVKPKKKPKK
jgi:hypothetical protein